MKNEDIVERIMSGVVFIHPTDTIYGIGCDATNEVAVDKVRKAKNRFDQPFSVIAPSKEWINENCIITKEAEEWLEKLPGPYTLILKLKNKKCIAKNVNNDAESLGVRIPKHWIKSAAQRSEKPIVTTSVNVHGSDVMTSVDDLDSSIKAKVDFIIVDGVLNGSPSTLVHLDGDAPVIKERKKAKN